MSTKYLLFSLQLGCHVATLFWLLSIPSLSSIAIVLLMFFLSGCLGMTVTYHRLLTHRSWHAPKWFEYLGTLLATIGCTGSSLAWTAAHRQHHANADKIGDPHSPQTMGYVNAQWTSMFSPIDIMKSPVIKSRFHRAVHKHYFSIIVFYVTSIYLVGGSVLSWFFVPACVLWNMGSAINTICHTPKLGYRNFDVKDASSNNLVLGYLMWGEGWHNNHHAHARNPNFGIKWWEYDIGYQLIKLLEQNAKRRH